MVTYVGGSDLESELASLGAIQSGGGLVLPWGGSRSRDLGERRSSSCLVENGISKMVVRNKDRLIDRIEERHSQ
jgi:hypothetical protein